MSSFGASARSKLAKAPSDVLEVSKKKKEVSVTIIFIVGFVMTVWLVAQASIAVKEGNDSDEKDNSNYIFSAISVSLSTVALAIFIIFGVLWIIGKNREGKSPKLM